MALAKIRSNIVGTVSPTFGIGKGGPLIQQGSIDPNSGSVSGSSGDLYIKTGTNSRIYQRRGSDWVELRPDILVRTVVNSSSYVISNDDYYVALRHHGVVLTLPASPAVGKRIIIKDEMGSGSVENPIVINTGDGSTIDGLSSFTATIPYTSLTITYAGDGWFII